jgi:hypothetical protein
LLEGESEAAQIRRSPRHESGELEKTRIIQASNRRKQEYRQLESQINALLKYDGEQLMVYAAGLDSPNNVIQKVYPEYLETKREIEALKTNGLASADPALVAKVEQMDALKLQLDAGIVTLRATLKSHMEILANEASNR